MEFTALKYFHEAVRSGSIRRAAETLHITASSVSRAIAALEHELGTPLFERTRKGVRLTAAGTLLERHTLRTLRDLERVQDSIDDLRGLHRGTVTLYAAEGLVAEFLPSIISQFNQKHPKISFEIRFGSTDEIVGAVIDDHADIGIMFNGPHRSDLASIVEHADALCCLLSPNHPLVSRAQDGIVKLEDVLDWPLALPEKSFGMRRMIDDAVAERSGVARLILNTNSLELAKRTAISGDAVAFMPGFMVREEVEAGRLYAFRIDSTKLDAARVTVCVHQGREPSFAARALLDLLRRRFADLKQG